MQPIQGMYLYPLEMDNLEEASACNQQSFCNENGAGTGGTTVGTDKQDTDVGEQY